MLFDIVSCDVHTVTILARYGLKQAPSRSMAQATLRPSSPTARV